MLEPAALFGGRGSTAVQVASCWLPRNSARRRCARLRASRAVR